MIEKFTQGELEIIRAELRAKDSIPKNSRKELHDYIDSKVSLIFKDQFHNKKIGYYPGPSIVIPKLADLCFKNYDENAGKYRIRGYIPNNISDEYMEMIDEILGIIEKHNKEWE